MNNELTTIRDADQRAAAYLRGIGSRPVYPTPTALESLSLLDEELPTEGLDAASTVRLLDEVGSATVVESNGGRYFGFVTGATLPVAAAADRLALAWDNSASTSFGSPGTAALERAAARWVMEILDLPRESAVGFTTSAAAGTIVALATARRALLARQGWDLDRAGLAGSPRLRVVASELAHVVVVKALRILGVGLDNVEWVPTDDHGRLDPAALPPLDSSTILILQAGEVNTGEFDPFEDLVPLARAAGAWVHVDGAFGLWARASRHRELTAGIDGADSWSVDGHKWLNTPYDSAMVIVRDGAEVTETMQSDAGYASSAVGAQKNLTLEFSRRARGIPVWAALRTLGRAGVADLIERTVGFASVIADGLRAADYEVLNRVVLNQVLVATADDADTGRILQAAQQSGITWFGATTWRGRPAFRISVSSWRTTRADVDALVDLLRSLRHPTGPGVDV